MATSNPHQSAVIDPSVVVYLSSLTNLDRHTGVIATGNPTVEWWSLRNIKDRFEQVPASRIQGPGVPFICPNLPAGVIPKAARDYNLKDPNREEVFRLLCEEPDFMCRFILGEQGSSYQLEVFLYDMWFVANSGEVKAFIVGKMYPGGTENDFTTTDVKKNRLMLCPKGVQMTIVMTEESLLALGPMLFEPGSPWLSQS